MGITPENTVIVLTACVNPNGMIFTDLQDPEERKKHYIDAIDYYLRKTSFNIIVAENSGYDLSRHFEHDSRLEFLTFDGNNFDKSLGKGYGEGLILKYVKQHSETFDDYNYMIKITGRHIIQNINMIIVLLNLSRRVTKLFYSGRIGKYKMATSDCFICSLSFCNEYLTTHVDGCNDSENVYFEHVLYKSVVEACQTGGYSYTPLPLPLSQRGVPGYGSSSFKTPTIKDKLYYFYHFVTFRVVSFQ